MTPRNSPHTDSVGTSTCACYHNLSNKDTTYEKTNDNDKNLQFHFFWKSDNFISDSHNIFDKNFSNTTNQKFNSKHPYHTLSNTQFSSSSRPHSSPKNVPYSTLQILQSNHPCNYAILADDILHIQKIFSLSSTLQDQNIPFTNNSPLYQVSYKSIVDLLSRDFPINHFSETYVEIHSN